MTHSITKITLCVLAALLPSFAVSAQPRISWHATTHDFGAFDEDMGQVSWRFTFTNTGDETLVITDARATCGCTTPRINNRRVEPGDTASILVTYDPTGRPGRFSKNVYVDSNTDPERTTLTVKGTVIGASNSVRTRYPVDMGPLKLRRGAVMMGRVKKGHTKTEFLDGYNRSTDTIAPVVVDAPRYINVMMTPAQVPPGEQVSFNIYFRSDACPTWDIVSDSVTIIPDVRRGDSLRFSLPVIAIVEEDFSRMTPARREKAPQIRLSDDKVDFGNISAANAPVNRSVTITNAGKTTMNIRRVYTTDPGISVTCPKSTLKNGKSLPVTVTVDPAAFNGDILNSRITVVTDDPATPVKTLRVVGY